MNVCEIGYHEQSDYFPEWFFRHDGDPPSGIFVLNDDKWCEITLLDEIKYEPKLETQFVSVSGHEFPLRSEDVGGTFVLILRNECGDEDRIHVAHCLVELKGVPEDEQDSA